MKKVLKYLKQNIIGFVVGGIVFGSFGVCAAVVISASNVGYSDTNDLGADNVQTAIDKLNTKATTKIKEAKEECPDKLFCKPKLCKRATTLHTEICSNTDTTGYCQADGYKLNGVITYGNLGTKGVLTSGDAFDCDVNGDGVYDSNTERFYYVSDMTNGVTSDSDIAVLVYYSNVTAGLPTDSKILQHDEYAYDLDGNAYKNGPVTAIKQLPTTEQWKNVSLSDTKRDITDEKGTVRKTDFSYEGYAARLLTVQEVNTGCGFTVGSQIYGELSSKCKYLLENTNYSISSSIGPGLKDLGEWLESPRSE